VTLNSVQLESRPAAFKRKVINGGLKPAGLGRLIRDRLHPEFVQEHAVAIIALLAAEVGGAVFGGTVVFCHV
jgi:hypothetical protein